MHISLEYHHSKVVCKNNDNESQELLDVYVCIPLDQS